MQEQSRKMIEGVIASNKKAIKNGEPKIILAQNPNILLINQARDKISIGLLLSRLRKQHNELLPFVKNIKLHIADITETTHVCAIYLLLCHIFDNWNSFFILAEKGKSSAAGNLIRMIKEGVMQVELFTAESSSGDHANLDKWVSGDIIQHGTGREKVSKYFDKYSPVSELDVIKLSTHIYQIESQVSHNAYATILELVSPFTEDYDFNGYSGYYRTLAWLRYASGSLEATNIALKMVYSIVVKDESAYKNLDKILEKYNPKINKDINQTILDDFKK